MLMFMQTSAYVRTSFAKSMSWPVTVSASPTTLLLTQYMLLRTAAHGAGCGRQFRSDTSGCRCAQAQSRVSPTQAQVLFATTPLWSAAIAMVLLPAEHLSILEGVGGALIVVATVLVTRT